MPSLTIPITCLRTTKTMSRPRVSSQAPLPPSVAASVGQKPQRVTRFSLVSCSSDDVKSLPRAAAARTVATRKRPRGELSGGCEAFPFGTRSPSLSTDGRSTEMTSNLCADSDTLSGAKGSASVVDKCWEDLTSSSRVSTKSANKAAQVREFKGHIGHSRRRCCRSTPPTSNDNRHLIKRSVSSCQGNCEAAPPQEDRRRTSRSRRSRRRRVFWSSRCRR